MARILVGIPTLRRPQMLARTIAGVADQQNLQEHQVEVLVCDNDPVGQEGAQLVPTLHCPFPVSSIVVEEPGISAARNAILDEALSRGVDYLAMIDDDEHASPNWIANLLTQLEATCADIVGGPVLFEFSESVSERVRNSGIFRSFSQPSGPTPIIDATGNVLFRLEALQRVGVPRFDPAFGLTGGGDTEYFVRLKAQGLTFAWACDAPVTEAVPGSRSTVRWVLKREFRYGNNRYRLTQMQGMSSRRALRGAVLTVAAAPFIALFALDRRKGLQPWRRIAYALGVISSSLGYRYEEYRSAHSVRRHRDSAV